MEQTDLKVTLDKEERLDPKELFFSITGSDSTILTGNDLFVRISGYRKEELIGRYHNVIRHPDMPRIVFKTFWGYLQGGKPIVAYVKNRTKEGGFYWVLAAVFPLGERYISIRLKPVARSFETVKEIYAALAAAEMREGMEGGEKLFLPLLNSAGFDTYEHFMSEALLQELALRTLSLPATCPSPQRPGEDSAATLRLKSVYEVSQALLEEYGQWFEKIGMFRRVKSAFEEKGEYLLHLGRDIVFLSLNASVSSYRIEKGGETLGVIAHDIRITAKTNETLITQFYTVIREMADVLHGVVFSVAAIRVQIEMITSFIDESVCRGDEENIVEVFQNVGDLIGLVEEYARQTKTLQLKLDTQIQECRKYLDYMEQQMVYLGYVQTYGIIEAAGNREETEKFGVIFSQLKRLTADTSNEVETMQKMGGDFYGENRKLMEKSKQTERLLKRLNDERIRMNKGEV